MTDNLVERLIERRRYIEKRLLAASGNALFVVESDATLLREAVERIFTLQELVSAGEELANAVRPLVEDSMERNGPQVSADIVEAYRTMRARQAEEHLT